MIKGFYKGDKEFKRPFIVGKIVFSAFGMKEEDVEFLVDTGADMTLLSQKDALRFGLDYSKLKRSEEDLGGIGGKAETYSTEIILKLEKDFATTLEILTIKPKIPKGISVKEEQELKDWYLRMPSLLGRNTIKKFGLYLYEIDEQVCLISETEIPKYINI